MIELRPYQREAAAAVRSAWASARPDALVEMATGLGKTALASELVRAYRAETGRRVLWVAHRRELVEQGRGALMRQCGGDAVGLLYGGRTDYRADILCSTIQSCTDRHVSRLPLSDYGLLVVDEAHHVTQGGAYHRLADRMREAAPGLLTLGLTATPYRADGKGLGWWWPEAAYKMDIVDGLKSGWLSPLRPMALELDVDWESVAVSSTGGDIDAETLGEVLDTDEVRARVVAAWSEVARDRPTVVFCPTVATAQHMAEAFEAAGVRAAAVWSEGMARADRARVLRDYGAGAIQVLANCAVLTEGWDAPRTSCVVVMRATRSKSLYVQMVGRGTRLSPETGKSDCIVVDLRGSHEMCGGFVGAADLSTRDPQEAETDAPPERDPGEPDAGWPDEIGKVEVRGHAWRELDVYGGSLYWWVCVVSPARLVRVAVLGPGLAIVYTSAGDRATAWEWRERGGIAHVATGAELDVMRAAESHAATTEGLDGRWARPNTWLLRQPPSDTAARWYARTLAAADRAGANTSDAPRAPRSIPEARAWSALMRARMVFGARDKKVDAAADAR